MASRTIFQDLGQRVRTITESVIFISTESVNFGILCQLSMLTNL